VSSFDEAIADIARGANVLLDAGMKAGSGYSFSECLGVSASTWHELRREEVRRRLRQNESPDRSVPPGFPSREAYEASINGQKLLVPSDTEVFAP
jgi:hypothetical protein